MANESNDNQIMTAVKDAATNAFTANCKAQGAYVCGQEWLCNKRCGLLNGFQKRLQENLQSYFGPTVDANGTINPSGQVVRKDDDFGKAFTPKSTTGKIVNVWLEDAKDSWHSENGKDDNFNLLIDEIR